MPNSGYFDVIFASGGTRAVVPDGTQSDGSISYTQGYGPNYTLPPATSGSLNVENNRFNQLIYDITIAIQQYQQHGTPPFITTSMNNGTPYSYSQYDRVRLAGVVYQSLTNSNTDTPPSANWAIATISSSDVFTGGTSTGSANSQVLATLSHSGFSLSNNGQTVIATAGFTNTGATQFNIASTGLTDVKKDSSSGPIPLTGGEIPAGGSIYLTVNTAGSCLILSGGLALGTASSRNASDVTQANVASVASATSGNLVKSADSSGTNGDSGIPVGRIQRAWAEIDGGTGAILAGDGITSCTAGGGGTYTVTPTNTMPAEIGLSLALQSNGVISGSNGTYIAELDNLRTTSHFTVFTVLGGSGANIDRFTVVLYY